MPKQGLKLISLRGLSGSGKTIAPHTLGDVAYYYVDNLLTPLLYAYVFNMPAKRLALYGMIAVSMACTVSHHRSVALFSPKLRIAFQKTRKNATICHKQLP